MKNFLYFFVALILISSCKKDPGTEIHPVDLKIKVAYPLESSGYQLPLTGVVVKVTNLETQNVKEFNLLPDGNLEIPGLAPGAYNLDASITIQAEQYTSITNIPASKPVTFNAAVKNKQIAVGFNEVITLNLITGPVNDWVIKQVYFAGSDRTKGALYRDQFIELYNNSDHLLYADSVFIAETVGAVSTSAGNTYHLLSSGQMDWSKSVNMPASLDPNNDYIYARAFLMIPGTGKQYPVQAGKSIVIAQSALNHKSPFTGTDGTSISVVDPSLTIDLSKADFEAHYAPLLTRPLASDLDNPNVPNLEVLSYFGTDMIFDTNGRYGYAVIKADGTQSPKDWPRYNYPTKNAPSSSATKYYQIPVKYVLDAVEVRPIDGSVAKKYGAALDAGSTNVPMGDYTSQSIIRKTESIVNGRIILKDTNNSTEDFTYFSVANPWGFK